MTVTKDEKFAAASVAAQRRLDGTICFFEAACAQENSADIERQREQAHAALDMLLDAKEAHFQEAWRNVRKQG